MHPETLRMVSNLGSLYQQQGKMLQAEQMYQRALAGMEQELGPIHPSTLTTLSNLGRVYHKHEIVQAEQMYQRALAGQEQELGLMHPSTLKTFRLFGLLYRDQGQTEKAEQLLQRAVLGYETVLGPDHPDTLRAVRDLKKLRVIMDRNGDKSHSAGRGPQLVEEKDRSLEKFTATYEGLRLDYSSC